jgi:hypothetical protein
MCEPLSLLIRLPIIAYNLTITRLRVYNVVTKMVTEL